MSEKKTLKKQETHKRRKQRARKKIIGTSERPRLSLFRSAQHVYAQVIDDQQGFTLATISSMGKKSKISRANKDNCTELGESLATVCKAKKISKVVFDKNGYQYHGRIKAFADGARKGGLDF